LIAFLLLAALLLAATLALLLPALLRRAPLPAAPAGPDERAALNLAVLQDQARELDRDLAQGLLDSGAHQSTRTELERRVAVDVLARQASATPASAPRHTAWLLALCLPLASLGIYSLTGTPKALTEQPAAQPAQAPFAAASAGDIGPEQIRAMVARLADKLKAQPDDAQGWRMLARSYETLGRFDEAVAAYHQLQRLTPDDAAMLLDYAVTLAMAKGRSLSGEPAALIARVLKLEPDNLQALALAGSEAFERQDYAQAVTHWQAVLAKVPPDTEMAQSVQASIEKAQALGTTHAPPRRSPE